MMRAGMFSIGMVSVGPFLRVSNVCLTVRRHVFDWHGKRGALFHRRLFLRILLDRQQTLKRALYSDFI
jgi:hypothetical protein